MTEKELIKKLRLLKPIRLSESRRESLWSQIASETFGMLRARLSLPRAVFVGSLAVLLVVGSGALVASAEDSVPGQALYPVKRQTENIRLLLTRRPDKRAKLQASYTERRVKEYELLIEKENGQDRLTLNQQFAIKELSTSIRGLDKEPSRIQRKEDLQEFIRLLEARKALIEQLASRTTGLKRQQLELIEAELYLILNQAQEAYQEL